MILLLKCQGTYDSVGLLSSADCDSASLGWGLRFCISNKFSDVAAAAAGHTTLGW